MPAGGAGLDDLYGSGRAPATWPKPPGYQPIGVSSWVNAVDRHYFDDGYHESQSVLHEPRRRGEAFATSQHPASRTNTVLVTAIDKQRLW